MSSPKRVPIGTRLALAMTSDGDVEVVKVEVPVYESAEPLPMSQKRAFDMTSDQQQPPDVSEKRYRTRMVICVACHHFGTKCSTLKTCNDCLFRNTACLRIECEDFDTGKCRKVNCGLAHMDDGYPLAGRLTITEAKRLHGDYMVEWVVKKVGQERELQDEVKQEIEEEVEQEAPEKEAKTESKIGTEDEAQADFKQEIKADIKQEVEAEVKQEVEAEVKQEVKKDTNEDSKTPAKERIIRCDRCRADGLECDNGHPCLYCTSAEECSRGSCMVNWRPGAVCGCDRAHKDDTIGGKRGGSTKPIHQKADIHKHQ